MDDDDLRSGQPAVHVTYTLPQALAASDVLLSRGLRLLAASAPSSANLALRTYEATALGQLDDVHVLDAGDRDDLQTAELKTAVFASHAFHLGALLTDPASRLLDQVKNAGHHLGIAFQILNDLADLSPLADGTGPAMTDFRLGRANTVLARMCAVEPRLTAEVLKTLAAPSGPSGNIIAKWGPRVRAEGSDMAQDFLDRARSEFLLLEATRARSVCLSICRVDQARGFLF